MLNPKTNQRELCYVVKVDDIKPIEGKDRVECAVVGGWTVMVPKEQFKPGDLGIYFEIDSKVDTSKPEFAFLEKRHGKIKTQKFKAGEGYFFSQGLLMAFSDFDWESDKYNEGDFLTKELGVIYADAEDNKRKSNKSNPNAKYQRMMNRYPKLAKSKFGRWCMRHKFAKKILYCFLGRKGDNPNKFPYWVVKTDEERIQNLVPRIPEFQKEEWIATEKRDGTSTTMTLKGHGRKQEWVVCSRNVAMTARKDGSWYDTNVYVEMADKYNIKNILKDLLTDEYEFVTIQGETFGEGIQKRDYGLKEHIFEVFNVIFGYKDGTTKRLNPIEMKELMDKYDVPTVPIVDEHFKIPDTCQEILDIAGGEASIYGGMREGLVFRTYDGARSFKAVDNEFLSRYHG